MLFKVDPDPDPGKEIEVDPDPDPDPRRGSKWIRIRNPGMKRLVGTQYQDHLQTKGNA